MKMKDCVIGEMYMIDTSKANDWKLKSLGKNRIYVLQYEGLEERIPDRVPYHKFKIIMGTCGRDLKLHLKKYNWGPGDTISFHGSERLRLKAL